MVQIELTAEQEAALLADLSTESEYKTADDYLRALITQQILAPTLERYTRSVAAKRLEKFSTLSDTDKTAVDAILNKTNAKV